MKTSGGVVLTFTISMGFFIMLSSVGRCETENADTLYVSKTGNGNYTIIQDAINNASTGDTIIVYNGTYKENIFINKSIKLLGMAANNTVINGNATYNIIIISGDNVLISNFTIENSGFGSGYNGINIQADHCIISNNIILNNSWSGIKTGSSCNNFTVKDNIIKKNGYGIFFNEITSDINFSENYIDNSDWDGIYLDQSNNGAIKDNVIGISGDDGVGISNCNNIKINNNVVVGSSENGIYLFSSKTIIKNNYIINNVNAGIFLRNSDNSEIYWNDLNSNKNGLELTYSSANNNIHDNNLTGNVNGIYISSDSGDNQFSDNVFSDNNEDFIQEESKTPGFELMLLFFSVALIIFLKRLN